WGSVIVHRRQDEILGTNRQLFGDALGGFGPDRIGTKDQLPGNHRRLRQAVVDHDGANVNTVVDAIESLRAVGVAAHRKRRVRRGCDFHARRAGAETGGSAAPRTPAAAAHSSGNRQRPCKYEVPFIRVASNEVLSARWVNHPATGRHTLAASSAYSNEVAR